MIILASASSRSAHIRGPGIAVAVLTRVACIRSRSARVPPVKTLRATPTKLPRIMLEQVLYGQLARHSPSVQRESRSETTYE